MTLHITNEDIASAIPGNRRRCLLALALNRQLGLAGKGYASVEANGAAYTQGETRPLWHLPREAVVMLKQFDTIGAEQGAIAARAAMKPRSFSLIFIKETPKTPPATRERKDSINKRRNKIAAKRREQGIVQPKPNPRYTGV